VKEVSLFSALAEMMKAQRVEVGLQSALSKR